MFKVGKRVLETECPLCDTIYLLDNNEVRFEEQKEVDEDGKSKPPKAIFYCPECNRYVRQVKYRLTILEHKPEEINSFKDFAYKD